jgi:hypothetical protein
LSRILIRRIDKRRSADKGASHQSANGKFHILCCYIEYSDLL